MLPCILKYTTYGVDFDLDELRNINSYAWDFVSMQDWVMFEVSLIFGKNNLFYSDVQWPISYSVRAGKAEDHTD